MATKKPSTPSASKKGAGKTNKTKATLVKVVVLEDVGTWVKPASGEKFYISSAAEMPQIDFEIKTDSTEPVQWTWKITWDAKVSGLKEKPRGKSIESFSDAGSAQTEGTTWRANLNNRTLGGLLTVEAKVANLTFKRSIYILGKNPTKPDVSAFLLTIPDTVGFDKLLEQETGTKHFIDLDGEPIVAFDKGFGITQMTNPAPSFEQAWSWKENLKAGSRLYAQKQKAAKSMFASHPTPAATDEMISNETYSRWNGGSYYQWNAANKAWERKSNILCDPATGNIGWDTNNEKNQNQSVDDLHKRDQPTYSKGKSGQDKDHTWVYSGVCYADHVNGN